MKLIFQLLMIGIFAFVAAGQNPMSKPDLSGTWEYVESNSPFKDRVLVITQTGDELSFVESYLFKNDQFTQKSTFYADGRGEVNQKQFPGGQPPSEVVSKTSWKKGKLFLTMQYAYMMENRGIRYNVTVNEEQTWSLSKDGETLTVNIKSVRDAPGVAPIAVPTTGKSTYRRKH